ncbi:MAG: bifunctional phosphopantothenoylcysteine decarboxylase/phosphopantothenate--cysteine ligase CoaBC [Rhodospirillales bacterium]|nr:bifunctional phosphopantothenoylcysteine decarboxylase/phosphopantothenate--cysteine ligase CoaBC [Rhodospirillales bacterium]
MHSLKGKKILLIISGGIAAYKALELIRLLRGEGAGVRCILTEGGSHFVTALSVSALSEEKVYSDLWSLTDEAEMGHIRLSREADLIVVAPASADLIAKLTHGLANDLASTVLLAADKPILIAPAMNPQMWNNPATQSNIATLRARGVFQCGPEAGDMACGETGWGRMSEPAALLEAVKGQLGRKALSGMHALVTSGPTYEAIDPVRFIGNRSSGKQGHAIASALSEAGARVTLVSGPVALPDPAGVKTVYVESAREMLEACKQALPADIAVFAAAVGDWRPSVSKDRKIKKSNASSAPDITLTENPDILHTIATLKKERPRLVIGFAAETENLEKNVRAKLKKKGCDWIVANEVGPDESGQEKAFGRESNQVYLCTRSDFEHWPKASKREIALKLAERIAQEIGDHEQARKRRNKKS